jgi:hypothetical protein
VLDYPNSIGERPRPALSSIIRLLSAWLKLFCPLEGSSESQIGSDVVDAYFSRDGTRIPARSRHVPACGRRYTNVSRGRFFGIAGRRMALWRLRRVGSIRHCSRGSRALRAPLGETGAGSCFPCRESDRPCFSRQASLVQSWARAAAFPPPHGRGDEFHHGGPNLGPRERRKRSPALDPLPRRNPRDA